MQSVVWMPSDFIAQIHADADNKFDLETGGTFMGYWASMDEAVVTEIIPAGPDALHNGHNFEPDQEWQLMRIAEIYEASGRKHTYLGDWHSHPNTRVAQLSWTDRTCAKMIIKTPKARTTRPIMAILAGTKYSWKLHPYLCQWRPMIFGFGSIQTDEMSVRSYSTIV